MKKRLNAFFLLIVLVSSFALYACSSGNDKSASGNQSKNGTTTIKVWAMGAEGKKLPDLVKDFESKNPGIKVDVQAIPWDKAHDKILTAVASQKGPDVLEIGTTWIPEFAKAGTFLDLSSYVKKYPNFKQSNYFEGAAKTMKYNGKMIAVPWYVDTRVLFYRKDLLKQAGYDQAPRTWDELKQAAAKLSARGDKYYGISIDQNGPFIPFILAWDNGWQFKYENGKTNFDDPKFKQAMKLYHSFFAKELAPTNSGLDIMQGFKNGTLPMFISGPWMVNTINQQLPDLKGKWGIATLPKTKTNTSMIGGCDFTIFHNSKHIDASLKFISYLTDVNTQVKWFKMINDLPARPKAWEDPVLKNDKMLNVFNKQLKNTRPAPPIPEYETLSQKLLHSLKKADVGNADLNQVLKEYEQTANQIMARK